MEGLSFCCEEVVFQRLMRGLFREGSRCVRIPHHVFLLCVIVLSGCATLPPGTGLKNGERVDGQIPRKAWVASVKIWDVSVKDRWVVEDSLRANIAVFLQESGYFLETSTLPGKVGPEDILLDFRFPRFRQERSVHPAYFPGALITLTFYIWFGGPVSVDKYELSGVLSVKDGTGRLLVESTAQIEEKQNISIYSNAAFLPSGLSARTTLVQDLVRKSSLTLRETIKP
jgi:hypothetical protein